MKSLIAQSLHFKLEGPTVLGDSPHNLITRPVRTQRDRLRCELDEIQAALPDDDGEEAEIESVLSFAAGVLTNSAQLWKPSAVDERQCLRQLIWCASVTWAPPPLPTRRQRRPESQARALLRAEVRPGHSAPRIRPICLG